VGLISEWGVSRVESLAIKCILSHNARPSHLIAHPLFREDDPVLDDQFSHVDQCIPHAAQGRIDADIGLFCDILETHLSVYPHVQYRPLFLWQMIHKRTGIFHDLLPDGIVFGIPFGVRDDIQNIEIFSGTQLRHALFSSEVIDHQVVRNAHHPLNELSLFIVAAGLQCLDHLDEGVLKKVIGQIPVLEFIQQKPINLLPVLADELL